MKKDLVNNISDELLAAFLDGNATASECNQILGSLADDAELREVLRISQLVDAELQLGVAECEIIPMSAMAANCDKSNRCALECEQFVLKAFDVDFDESQLIREAVENGWYKESGTALHNVGRILESRGLVVERRYKSTIDDIVVALTNGEKVIVAVDGGELLGNRANELREDVLNGPMPDHTVVVLLCDTTKRQITIFDPNSINGQDVYSFEQFEAAWQDSKNYLITINLKDMKPYDPKPIDLSDVELTEDLNDLREAIAENAHDVWALERQSQGWTYGPKRDDAQKQTPCMVPYSQLPDSEKKFDRDMAMSTLKLVKKLGYDLIKREETALYKELLTRIRSAKVDLFCPYCPEGCNTPVSKHDVFCSRCGHKLDIDWTAFEE